MPSRSTAIEDLKVLTAGKCDRQTIRLLAQGCLGPLFVQLKEQFDFVIVDSSPILPVADGLIIAQQVDAVLFSIFRDVSRKTKVSAASERLQALGVRILGAVVTGAHGGRYGNDYDQDSPYPSAAGVGSRLIGFEHMMDIIRISAAVVLIVGAGLVHGAWTDRWGTSPALTALAARFESVPHGHRRLEGDGFRAAAGRASHGRRSGLPRPAVLRTRVAGSAVTVLLLGGLPGKISTHTPDVCYAGAGYSLDPPTRLPADLRPRRPAAEFRTALATREGPTRPSCGSSGVGTPRKGGRRPTSPVGNLRMHRRSASSMSSGRPRARSSIPETILATTS